MESQGWRSKGNEHFSSYQLSTNLQGKKHFLKEAIKMYAEAYRTAKSPEDRCSACKNYGIASWKLTSVLKEISVRQNKSEIESCHKEAVEFLSKALACGRQCKDRNWLDSVTVTYVECVEVVTKEKLDGLTSKEKFAMLESYVNVMEDDSQRGNFFFEMATLTYGAALDASALRDYRTALGALHDAHRPVHECLRLCQEDAYIITEASVIQNDLCLLWAIIESLQAIDQGDNLLKIAVDVEGINMDLMYDVIDWYKQAILLAHDVEVELEAHAMSQLGYVYDKVLLLKSKAKEYFMRCMQLAMSLDRKNFHSEKWFQTCAEALQRYQQESVVEEEARKQEQRKVYIEELKNELADLNNANTNSGVQEFLKHVYTKYPPKNPSHTLDVSQGMKKALLKAIQHYHPDKQDREKYGEKWAVLCEEIAKLLTPRYETYKFDPSTTTTSSEENVESQEPATESADSTSDENHDAFDSTSDESGDAVDSMWDEDGEQNFESEENYWFNWFKL